MELTFNPDIRYVSLGTPSESNNLGWGTLVCLLSSTKLKQRRPLTSWQSRRARQGHRCQSPASTGRFSFCWSALGRRKLEQVEMRSSRSRHCCKAPCCCIPCCNWSLADCTSEHLAVCTRKRNIGHMMAARSVLQNSHMSIWFLVVRELAWQSHKVLPSHRCQRPASTCRSPSAIRSLNKWALI